MPTPRNDGLDIHPVYQPVADWAAATNYPLMSVKIGEGRNYRTDGLNYFRKFREHKVKYRGMYWWLRSDSSMRRHADAMLNGIGQLGGLQVGEFIQVDWEVTPNVPLVTSDQCRQFCQYMDDEWPGRIIVYSSDWLPDSTLDADSRREFDEWFEAYPTYPLWFANYSTSDKPTGGWAECSKYGADIWQYTSSYIAPGYALKAGVPTRCDANMVMNWDVLDRITLRTEAPKPQPKPEPKPQPPVVKTSWTFPGGNKMTVPLDYGIRAGSPENLAGVPVDSWWTEMAITPAGLVWSGAPTIEGQVVRKYFVAMPNLPRAPRVQDDDDMINRIRTFKTIGPAPSTFFDPVTGADRPLSNEWKANSVG